MRSPRDIIDCYKWSRDLGYSVRASLKIALTNVKRAQRRCEKKKRKALKNKESR